MLLYARKRRRPSRERSHAITGTGRSGAGARLGRAVTCADEWAQDGQRWPSRRATPAAICAGSPSSASLICCVWATGRKKEREAVTDATAWAKEIEDSEVQAALFGWTGWLRYGEGNFHV